jgi:Ca2+-binding EF-hand superfamily protein
MHRAVLAFVVAIAGLAGAGGTAWAQSDFEQTDRNHDGKIDLQEFIERQTEIFFFADANKNGRLMPEEIVGVEIDRFQVADRNGDGSLSMAEFLEARTIDFENADQDQDATLSPGEIDAAK